MAALRAKFKWKNQPVTNSDRYTHIVDYFYDYQIRSLIEKVLETKYQVTDYWYRIEYQHRGSPHLHGIFWNKDAPDVSNIENESEEYIMEVIKYFSDLVQAWNPIINPNKLNKGTKTRECRFKFPMEMQEAATLNKTDDHNEFVFRPKRNDPHLNKFNAFLIQLWRASMDISPVISRRALLAYLTKYISKCEVQSTTLKEIFTTTCDLLDSDLAAKKVIHKVFMKSCAERDISAQEVCHSLLRLKLHSAGGRQFVIVNLSEKKWLQLQQLDEEYQGNKHGKNTVEKYIDRPNRLENIALWDFAKNFNVNRLSNVNKSNIVRVFPKLKKNDDETLNEEYYKQQVLLHLPWRNECDIKTENETCHEIFEGHNLSNILQRVNKLDVEEKNDVEDEYESSEESSDDEGDNILKELLSSRLGPKSEIPKISLGNREVDKNYNWTDSFANYEECGTIIDFENYIDEMKKKEEQKDVDMDALPDINLSNDQREIIDIVTTAINKMNASVNNTCSNTFLKRIIVQGKAGKYTN
ncbi:uncharacterized protein LOC127750778 [Frankliniella occidentalis]|uniref:Uncharacterized protein LOC127750778 n=1 Tax=Frankliniella occidentalis TaxID=133901 RepID=A0A9C6XS72_FRAOC|nr:uncharacterized protein LOC127750778 [Frankliniella occidentalis]